MTSPSPCVSVVLPVYNGLPYLHAAISSILSQSFADFELIIIDDGSTDESASVVNQFDDQRIRFLRQDNQGLARTLNRGISLSRGRYIARQDADDLSDPERFAQQVAYMDSNPDCVLLGTWAQIMEVDRLVERYHRHPVDEAEIRYQMLFNNPFVHSSVMLQRAILQRVGGYTTDSERYILEDYELWSRLSRIGSVANVGKVLQIYREIPGSLSRVGPSAFRRLLITLSAENVAEAAQVSPEDPEVIAIAALTHGDAGSLKGPPDFLRMQALLLRAIESFASEPQAHQFRQEAIGHVQGLKAAWMISDSPAFTLLHSVGPVRNVAKRFWRLIQRFRRRL